MNHIKSFKELGKSDALIAGGKGASLGEMTNAGIPVPPGFVILSSSFEYYLSENDLTQEIDAILKKINHKEMEQVERASEDIGAMILEGKMPFSMQGEIKESFAKLKSKYVAVRSSATAEDGAEHAWAGQLDSFLNTTSKDLENNIKKCFASLFTPRAIFYRFEKGLHTSHIGVAVVVQEMVPSEKSGVAFSVHPVTEDRNQMIIEGSWGLGEAIVSGQVTPDSYVIEKDSKTIIDTNIAEKSKGLFRSPLGGNEWKDIPSKKADEQCLSGKELQELGEIIIKIENHYGFPCDIEWAFAGNKFYITQSRPITTLKPIETGVVKDEMILMGAWDTPPLELFHWFDSSASLHMESLVGVLPRVFSYSRDGLLYQCFFKRELDGLKDKFEENDGDKGKLVYISKIYNDFWKNIVALEDYLKLMESKDPSSLTNNELAQVVVECATVWHKIVMQVWYALFLDIWYPNQHDYKEVKAIAAKARDHAGHLHVRSNIVEKEFYREIRKRLSYSEESLRYLHPDEIEKALAQGVKYQDVATERLEFCVTESVDGIYKIHSGNDAQMLFDKYKPPALGTEKQSSLLGIPACIGKVRGSVRVIKLNKEFDSFLEGEILVAPQTMVHYIPVMQKAAAILTEFGGLTSHAAIVSRELKKPCIVGIKNLLASVKDGDVVEVDADKGVVRILK